MLSKKRIDKKLRKYIKEHLGKGYSKRAVRKVLVEHGYSESYIDGLIRKHREIQFVRNYAIIVSLLFITLLIPLNLISTKNQPQQITGYATTIGTSDEGCCTSICQQSSKNECYGKFVSGGKCSKLLECNVGCCIDREGYCLTNYLYGNCIRGYGISINRDCRDVVFCRNLTDKSYASRQYNLKDKKGAGLPALKPASDYYKSSFNIRYYLYDKTSVLSVSAVINEDGQQIDSIALYDDGYHNDGAKNDNIYGNNWDSSKISSFDGFKKLDIDIVVGYEDGTQQKIPKIQNIAVVSNSKCLPIYSDLSNTSGKYNIIIAANNYDNLGDGYQKFETDAQNFLNLFFSIDKFSMNKEKFNVYRLEQSLSYFNVPTLISVASNSCPSYSSKKDIIAILDSKEDYCVAEKSRVFRTNPQFSFYKNISSGEINSTFNDFCSFVLTPKKFYDELISFATPPSIIVHTSENLTYNTTKLNLSFSISALNYPANYSVFLDNRKVANKKFSEDITEGVMLNLANGTNYVLIEAVDKNRNLAFSQLTLNATIE